MSCYIEDCDNMNEEFSDFCKTHNRLIRERIAEREEEELNDKGQF